MQHDPVRWVAIELRFRRANPLADQRTVRRFELAFTDHEEPRTRPMEFEMRQDRRGRGA